MKRFKILFVISLLALASCEKEDVQQVDELEQTGVLGQWKFEKRTVDGVSNLTVECCDYIVFETDSDLSDLKGTFRAFGAEYETNGVFELNTSNGTIQFDYNDSQKIYEFQISDDLITFTYSEGNQEVIEDWRKEE